MNLNKGASPRVQSWPKYGKTTSPGVVDHSSTKFDCIFQSNFRYLR